MTRDAAQIDDLMARASRGEDAARHELLDIYRQDLRRMVEARLDRRINVRVDASDVVQDALIDAWKRMDDYLQDRPLPFLAWLRQITNERIIDTHRRHVTSQRRGVQREAAEAQVSNESAVLLANRLFANDTSPSNNLARKEFHVRLREAIIALPSKDRDVLMMRHIEQRDTADIATALGISQGAVKARLLRALLRLRGVLGSESRAV
jgi:RNA polymerase sigma-70 factor, ECF subfamily